MESEKRELNACDIIFTFDNGSIVSKAIYWFLRIFGKKKVPKLSHTALYVGSDNIIDITWGGVVKGELKKYSKKRFTVYTKRLRSYDGFNVNLALLCAHQMLNRKYAYLQLFAIFIKKVFGLYKVGDWSKDDVICSEFICKVYSVGGILLTGIECAENTPIDIYRSNKLIDV